jgi:four helix bundle protein
VKHKHFGDLPVWNSAIELAVRVYALTKDRVFAGRGDLSSQLRRAALSVSNNIAEGFERGTTAELLTFLYIARGSAGEVRSMLHFMEHLTEGGDRMRRTERKSHSESGSKVGRRPAANLGPRIPDLKSQISDPTSGLQSEIAKLKSLAESCSRQIRAWAETLQNTDIRGQRHLTRASREGYDAQRRAEAFWKHVDAVIQARSHGSNGPHE